MFEQESYNQEVLAVPTQPGDLFYNYEIRNWNFTPRLYKILIGSAIFNIVGLLAIASSGVLTARGCDSPFVGRVCQVLDTVYVGSLLLGTDRDYVDAPYEKTDLGDAEVTFLDVTGVTPPLTYPDGYFQLANPEQQFGNVTDPMGDSGFIAPGIPYSNPTIGGSGLVNTPAIRPSANPNAIEGALPTDGPLGGPADNPTIPGNRKGRRGGKVPADITAEANTNLPDGNSNTGNPTVDPTKPAADKDINRRPFVDLAAAVNALLVNKELNLDTEFNVSAKGKLTNEGKLEKKTFRFVSAASSDPKMVSVIKQSVEAFNDSGMLQYLEQLNGKDLNLTIAQDKENVSGEVRSEIEFSERANSLATGLRIARDFEIGRKKAKIARFQADNRPEDAEALQNAIDELDLLTKTDIVAEGRQLVIKFSSPKAVMHGLVQRKLDAQAKEIKKESGTNQVGANENTARR